MKKNIPSLASLQAFDAVARTRSFTRAALELDLTQAAVTHQIKILEESLGVKLFNRSKAVVSITDAASDYLNTVQASLYDLTSATNRLIYERGGDVVTVNCLGTFALKRLLPALEEFRSEYPEITFHIRTMVKYQATVKPDFDIAIWHGLGNWPNVKVERIVAEEIFPVCSPTILQSGFPLRKPADARHHAIIRANSEILRDDWPFWLDAAGIGNISFASEMSCNYLLFALQAALDGLGLAIGRTGLVEQDLARGALIEPFSLRLPSPTAYYVVTPLNQAESHKVTVFKEWILDRLRLSI